MARIGNYRFRIETNALRDQWWVSSKKGLFGHRYYVEDWLNDFTLRDNKYYYVGSRERAYEALEWVKDLARTQMHNDGLARLRKQRLTIHKEP